VGLEKTIETIAELSVLCMAMFLAAFFCFRVLLVPEASSSAIYKIHEVEELLSENK
tara:strand:- start:57 stop:224 length:168 start_codon:yes stop_codon:yes gene_type:complete